VQKILALLNESFRRRSRHGNNAPMSFIPRIESLRGIAALTVVAGHVWGEFSDTPSAGWDTPAFYVLKGLSNSTGAVVGFFVISGFVLARSLEANPEAARYFRNRAFRLFPAAVAVVGLLTALHSWFGIYVMYEADFSPGNVLLNMLMIRTDINAVMWSMKVECFATPLILFSAWLVKRGSAPSLWVVIVVLFGLSFWGPYVHALGDSSNLAPLYAFIVGVLAQHYGNRLSDIRPSSATVAAILSVVIFCYCGTRKQTAPILLIECLSAAWLVALIAWRPVAIFRPLDLSVVRFYGRISYSFYLLHVLGMLFANRLLLLTGVSLAGLPVSVGTVALTALSVIITTPAAYLSWRFIEMPGIKFGKRGLSGRSPVKVELEANTTASA
jgi:peptidoglycan/LPS O-acetylase OafA/YrhL